MHNNANNLAAFSDIFLPLSECLVLCGGLLFSALSSACLFLLNGVPVHTQESVYYISLWVACAAFISIQVKQIKRLFILFKLQQCLKGPIKIRAPLYFVLYEWYEAIIHVLKTLHYIINQGPFVCDMNLILSKLYAMKYCAAMYQSRTVCFILYHQRGLPQLLSSEINSASQLSHNVGKYCPHFSDGITRAQRGWVSER